MIEIIRQKSRLFPSFKNLNMIRLGYLLVYFNVLEPCLSGTYPKFNATFSSHFVVFLTKYKLIFYYFNP
jgi:hypothetical protein